MDADLIIVGSGVGGATLASSLAATGLRILVLEKGRRLLPCPEARDDVAIFQRGHFAPTEQWLGSDDTPFVAGNYYVVGGNSKFYGAVMYRFREADFRPRRHMEGASPGWPISYADMETWYCKAEALFRVRGTGSEDPTEPPHSVSYPYPPVPDEKAIQLVRERLSAAGAHPASLPLAIDIEKWLAEGQTGWDAFPNTGLGKIDAESGPLADAIVHSNVTVLTDAEVLRLETDSSGRIVKSAVVRHNGGERRLEARAFAVAAGAIQTAALLLRSASESSPNGLANRSDQLGRNFMNHNSSAMIALDPRLKNTSVYQKTLSINDFYDKDPVTGYPLGNVQGLGRLTAPILRANAPTLPMPAARLMSAYAFGWFLQSEDLPNPDSRVFLKNGQIAMHWERSNMKAHEALIRRTRDLMKRAGFPLVFVRTFGRKTTSHQCGTARIGNDPMSSVLSTSCHAHDVENLWVTDASCLPTSAAVNPALTVAALALKAGENIEGYFA